MYGKTNGLAKRIKIRVEHQLNSSIIFGATYSFKPTSDTLDEKNQDIFKAYMQIPFSIQGIMNSIN
jgi:hypothetical protein